MFLLLRLIKLPLEKEQGVKGLVFKLDAIDGKK